MKKQLVLIKLGGSLITDKRKPYTINKHNIELLAAEFSDVHKEMPESEFIIGSGGGSFAHFPAHEYGLRKGAHTKQQTYGMCLTHNAALRLSNILASTLTNEGLPVFTLSPAGLVASRNRKIDSVDLKTVKNLLNKQIIPLLHGDTIYDHVLGTYILSTEEILKICAETLRQDYEKVSVIYLSDTDGVMNEDGSTIRSLGPKDSWKLSSRLNHDTTGGMEGKISSARSVARIVDEVYIISGKKRGALKKAINGKNTGTKIRSQ